LKGTPNHMPNFTHCMLDLEALSLRKDACIIQIAAIMFDPETGERGATFNQVVNETSLEGAQIGHIDVATVAWWMKQSVAPILGAQLTDEDDALPLGVALCMFEEWLQEQHGEDFSTLAALWSHGATFDIVVLENAFNRCGWSKPWSYKVERDTRTLYAIAPGGMPAVEKDPEQEHDALYDCEIQIKQVVGALAALRAQDNAARMHRDYVAGGDAVADTQRAEDGDKLGVWHSAPASTPATTSSSSTSTAGIGAVVSS
jgi:hypothetical protein